MSTRLEWNKELVYHEGDRFFADLCRSIAAAEKSISLETYIFDRDSIGNAVLRHLSDAVVRGVQVRVLLDGVGCSDWTYNDLDLLHRANIEARFFHPLPWHLKSFSLLSILTPRRFLSWLWKLNRRNHRKTCVIDGSVAYLGGLNISARHSHRESGPKAWRDSSVRVEGSELQSLVSAFEYAWGHPRSVRLRWRRYRRLPFRPSLVRLNITHKQRRAKYRDLIRRIMHAKRRVWITNPYFIPDYALIRALRTAAFSGVDVRILLSKRSDIWGIKWAIQAFYSILLSARVRIFEYHASILHAKIMVVDQWTTIGSSNLNHRSLFQDLEVDVVLAENTSVHSIEQQFLQDLKKSDQIDLRRWLQRSWMEKILEKLALVFKKWL